MGKLMAFTRLKLDNSFGGGHLPAAGGSIQFKDKNKFKELAIAFLKGQQNE